MWFKEVAEFIQKRFGNFPKEYWNSENCYYFAVILCERFYYLRIYYDSVEEHFLAGFGSHFFDVCGEKNIENFKNLIPLDEIKISDSLWYNRLMEDCVK